MKGAKVLLCLLVIVILSSCASKQHVMNHEMEKMQTEIDYKTFDDNAQRFHSNVQIKTLNDPHFNRVEGWYGENEVLLSLNDGLANQIEIFNLFTAERKTFYETSKTITQVQMNPQNTYIAVESKDIYNNSILTILNMDGQVVYEDKLAVDFIEIAWSPYDESSVMLTYYYPSLTTTVEIINVVNSTKKEIEVVPYVQWFNGERIAYFNWDSGTSLQAPIELYDINTGEKENLSPEALLFHSIENYFMYMQYSEDLLSVKFMNSNDKSEVNSLQIPTLNSHAGYIWTPFFDWANDENIWFTFEAKQAGSIMEYEEGFQLISFDVISGEKRTILSVDTVTKIDCSSNGEWCLIGDQFENVVNTETGKKEKIMEE